MNNLEIATVNGIEWMGNGELLTKDAEVTLTNGTHATITHVEEDFQDKDGMYLFFCWVHVRTTKGNTITLIV